MSFLLQSATSTTGAAGAVWTPASLPSVLAYWVPQTSVTQPSSGNGLAVSVIPNLVPSATAYDWLQSTSGRRPIRQDASSENGKRIVTFDGVDDSMTFATTVNSPAFFAMRFKEQTIGSPIGARRAVGQGGDSFSYFTSGGNQISLNITPRIFSTGGSAITGIAITASWHTIEVFMAPTAASYVTFNGTQRAIAAGFASVAQLTLADVGDNVGSASPIMFAAAALFSAEITGTDLTNLRAWLAAA